MQYVKIDLGSTRAYTYAWAGETPLAVGDWVVVPSNSFHPNPSTGKVLRVLKSCDFTGKVTVIRQRIDMNPPRQVDTSGPTPDSGWDDYGYHDASFDPSVHGSIGDDAARDSREADLGIAGAQHYRTHPEEYTDRAEYSWGEGD